LPVYPHSDNKQPAKAVSFADPALLAVSTAPAFTITNSNHFRDTVIRVYSITGLIANHAITRIYLPS